MIFINEEETFALNPDATVRKVNIPDTDLSYIEIDNFYKNPHLVNKLAHSIPPTKSQAMCNYLPGSRINASYDIAHFTDYFFKVITDHWDISVRPGGKESLTQSLERMTFMVNVVSGENLPATCPHVDIFEDGFFASSICITPSEQCKGGTGFYAYVGDQFPTTEQAMKDITEYMSDDAGNWKLMHVAQLEWNKCIVYPSNWWHHAYIKSGWFTGTDYRLTQQIFI